ncbi:LysM domain-containing protein [Murinocardiopsis flavida]|uniref:LysM domain-containing protein n=1 Tax=Murinocardiopsis flavida TaxID=645275 RepID=A0A2P8DU50_9ACTN|nr:LysM peptidoglycan-binding domain-containing protein [Murinocardiopsis flavida]PSL00714.1 LysM domain-containing protein [Murinocardiopsis flavida]
MRIESAASPGGAPSVLGGLPDLHSALPPRRIASWAGSLAYRAAAVAGLGDLRLTRRGRVVFVSVLAVLAGAALALLVVTTVALGAGNAGAATGGVGLGEPSVTVREGDTLWTIAERLRPDEDPRRTVEELVSINNLTTPRLAPGQELVLPGA